MIVALLIGAGFVLLVVWMVASSAAKGRRDPPPAPEPPSREELRRWQPSKPPAPAPAQPTRPRPARRPAGSTVADLRPLLDRADVLVVDVETTGFGPRAEVLAVAVIDTTGAVRLNTVSLPQGRIPSGASDVHYLTRERLRRMGARPWPEVHAELRPLLRDATSVIAWNAEYDRRMLKQTAERHGLRLPAVLWHCAMIAEAHTRDAPGDRAPWAKLGDVARRLGVAVDSEHEALADVQTTLAVVRHLVADRR